MWVSSQFPNTSLKTEPISKDDVFPFFSEVGDRAVICNDGAVVFFFEIVNFGCDFVRRVIEYLSDSRSTLQLYKLRSGGDVKFYGSVKIGMDYSVLKLKFIDILKRFFVGCDDVLQQLDNDTSVIADNFCGLLGSQGRLVSPVGISELHKFLLGEDRSVPIADVSVLKISENRLLGMLSLSDVTAVMYKEFMTGFDYLQVFSLCLPSLEYTKKRGEYFVGLFNLLENLRLDDKKVSFDIEKVVRTPYKLQRLCFYANTIMICGDSLSKLTTEMERVRKLLLAHGLVSYVHTGSAREHYLSCFPGKAEFGYYYQIVDCKVMPDIVGGFFDL